MYTFNGGLTAPPLLSVEAGGGGGGGNVANTTCAGNIPRTPEILNSLIAMTNPLEYSYPSGQNQVSLRLSYTFYCAISIGIIAKIYELGKEEPTTKAVVMKIRHHNVFGMQFDSLFAGTFLLSALVSSKCNLTPTST